MLSAFGSYGIIIAHMLDAGRGGSKSCVAGSTVMYKGQVKEYGFCVLRRASYALMFLVFLTAGASAQQTSAADATADRPRVERYQTAPVEPDLSASAEIINQDYCRVTPEDHAVHFSVRLTFTNVSKHRVILAREVERPPVVNVARNSDDGQKGKFEYTFGADLITGVSTLPQFGDLPDETYFIILLPGRTYEATVAASILVSEKSVNTGKGPGGDHVLQIALNTLPYQSGIYTNPVDARQLSLRWSKYGHLASGWIYSDFAPFSLPEAFDDAVCDFS
jgi:hypothetical protein